MRCTLSAVLLVLSVGLAPGCGDGAKPSGSASGATSGSAKTVATAAPEPPKPKGMPSLLVDAEGPYIGTDTRLITQLYAIGQGIDSYSCLLYTSPSPRD